MKRLLNRFKKRKHIAVSDKGLEQPKTPTLIHDKVHLVFGVQWVPMAAETARILQLQHAAQEGYRHYAINTIQESTGLVGELENNPKNPYSAALVLSQNFAQGGTELFIFQKDELFGLVGLIDYSPTPGFDAIGSWDVIHPLAHEFSTLNSSQLIHYYGNVDWFENIESIELAHLSRNLNNSSKLRRIPNLKRIGALFVAGIMSVGVAYASYDYYEDLLREQEQRIQAAMSEPNKLYEESLVEAMKQTGPPGSARLELWRNFLSKLPIAVNGWSVRTINCNPKTCNVNWVRRSGNYNDFDVGLPEETHVSKNTKVANDLVTANINTSHDLSKFAQPEGIQLTIDKSTLMVELEVKNQWASRLQDISLIPGTFIHFGDMTLYGTSLTPVNMLRKPITRGTWRIKHAIWSLHDLTMPNYVVPEQLTISFDFNAGMQYELEGSVYAKGK
jgi:hypothetical protein